MATYTLGALDSFQHLRFSNSLWRGIDIANVGAVVRDLYPPVSRVTSKSENKAFCWFFGKVVAEGPGHIEVTYPYKDEGKELTIRNVSFSQIPYILIKAVTDDKSSEFLYWKDSVTGKIISEDSALMISKDVYSKVTGFIATFKSS